MDRFRAGTERLMRSLSGSFPSGASPARNHDEGRRAPQGDRRTDEIVAS